MIGAHLAALGVALSLIAAAAPEPSWVTDRGAYERMTREWFIPGCGDYHCFRVLVPWMLRLVPDGLVSSVSSASSAAWIEWKAYAVVCEAFAAFLMARWVVALGFTPKVGLMVMWATGLGSGSLYVLFDPHSSDPLMHLLAPALALLATRSKIRLAGAIAAIGTLAKEFAMAPLFIFAAVRALQRRRPEARPLLIAAAVATLTWVVWQVTLRTFLLYETGPTRSANLLSGGFIYFWLTHIHPRLIVESIAGVFAGFWLLWFAGLTWGGATIRHLTISALPAILLFCYVQQPDRALWNFGFVVMPAAAVVLQRVDSVVAWGLVAAQVAVNLRIGAQLPFAPPARFGFVLALGLSMIAVWQAARFNRTQLVSELSR